MTLHEFLNALRNTPRNWALDGDAIRDLTVGCQCPIDAVLGRGAWKKAIVGQTPLSITDAKMIIDAADWTERYKELRHQLLQACALAEEIDSTKENDNG